MSVLALLVFFVGFGPQPAPPAATVCKLRHVAATDAVKAVTAFATQNKLAVVVVAEPVSNCVFVAGDAAHHKRVVGILTELDAPPPSVVVPMSILLVPPGFAEEVGLGDGEKWVLTPREAKMLTASIRREKDASVLATPSLLAVDNQTAYVQVGSTSVGVAARVTPRILPDGVVQLRVEADVAQPTGATGFTTRTARHTESVSTGATLVMKGGQMKTADGRTQDVLLVLTPAKVLSR